ncbi:MAG TPA: YvcK family protein [Candidatus Aminicenantes bacterium]|nr:YvcK family protein [Candidatus Aminicenantes bacterium]
MGGKRKKEKIVVIGGGTGSYNVLCGLKKYPVDLTAVVTMMDSGGSTGRLRDEFGFLPPGDVRRCLIALSSDTGLLRKLFEYRFDRGSGLSGHSFGNLFLTVLRDLTGGDAAAVREAAKILNVRGQVLPVTLNNCQLGVVLENGQTVVGETNISIPRHDPRLRIRSLFVVPRARINKEAEAAILEADKIVIGPGDLYTSILPNIAVSGVKAALRKTRARVIYVCNIMTKAGETLGFTAVDFVRELEHYLGRGIVRDIVCNDQKPPARLLKRYAAERAEFVEPDLEESRVRRAALLGGRDLARHDSDRLARVLMSL